MSSIAGDTHLSSRLSGFVIREKGGEKEHLHLAPPPVFIRREEEEEEEEEEEQSLLLDTWGLAWVI